MDKNIFKDNLMCVCRIHRVITEGKKRRYLKEFCKHILFFQVGVGVVRVKNSRKNFREKTKKLTRKGKVMIANLNTKQILEINVDML